MNKHFLVQNTRENEEMCKSQQTKHSPHASRNRSTYSICFIALEVCHHRAIACGFLLNNRFQDDLSSWLKANPAKGVKRVQICCMTSSHICTSPAIEPVSLNDTRVGRMRPQVFWANWHHVDVSIENQALAFGFMRVMDTNNHWGFGVLRRELTRAFMFG